MFTAFQAIAQFLNPFPAKEKTTLTSRQFRIERRQLGP
jgi:hypothetical protein